MDVHERAAIDLLRELEWIIVAEDVGDFEVCPRCDRFRENPHGFPEYSGHAEDCDLARILRESEGSTTP